MQTQTGKGTTLNARGIASIAGIFLAILACLMPMDIFGMNYMFSVHMAQHLLLSLATPPLILLALTRERLGRFLDRHHTFARCLRYLTNPFVASGIFNANIWIWHAPPLMQIMMANALIHAIVDLLYLSTALLFWLPLFDLLPEEMHPLSIGKKLIYIFFSDMPMMLIGAGLTFSPPLYTFTMTNPPMHMTVTPIDQQIGGLLMWVVGGVFLLVIVSSILFLRWMLAQERKQQEQEEALDDDIDEAIAEASSTNG
jgi:cytochrome c oxidase assembly factor CtaG